MWFSKLKAVGKVGNKKPPHLYGDLTFIWEAFVALSSSRDGAITFSEIESWLNLNGISNLERRQETAHLIRIMDLKYIEFMQEKYSKQKERKK